jgi:PAS domain S-box-containing protein
MYTAQADPGSNPIEIDLTDGFLKNNFDTILDFITDICKVSNAFISIKLKHEDLILSKKGLDNFNTPNTIKYFKELTSKNEVLIFPDLNQNCNYHVDGNEKPFTFFAGFPLNPSNKLIRGSLCFLDTKNQKLNTKELKIIRQCVSQIESTLNLSLKNSDLQSKLKESTMNFQSLIENSNEIIFELTLQGTIASVSKRLVTSLGHEADEMIGENFASILHTEDQKKCFDFLSTIKLGEKDNKNIIYRVLHQEGHYVWHSSTIILLEKNNEKRYIGNCSDITAFVESQQKLQLQKKFYENVLDSLPTDFAVFDSNHKYLYLNPVAIKNKKLRDYIIGKDDFEYAAHTNRTDDFAIKRRTKFNKAIQSKEILSWEETLCNASGEESFHKRKFTPVFNEDGTLEIMIGFSVDVTETKKIQNEIFTNRKLIASILENITVGILVQGPESEIIENNKAACELLGLTKDQLLGKTSFDKDWQVIHEDGSTFTLEDQPVPQAIQKRKSINNIVMGIRRPIKNDLIWLLVDAIPVFGDKNELLYVICSFKDITTQKKNEKKLKISNERYTYLNMATSDVIWDWQIDADSLIISDNYSKLFGHKLSNRDNCIKIKEFNTLVHPKDLPRVIAKVRAELDSKAIIWYDEFRFLKSNGTYAFIKYKAYIIRDNLGKAIRMIGAQTDITVEQNLQEKLTQGETKFKAAFEHSSLGIAFGSLDGHYTNVNNQFCNILGYTKKELKKLNYREITHPDDLKEDRLNEEKLISNEVSFYKVEKRYIKKDNTIVWTNLFVSAVRDLNNEVLYFIIKIIDVTDTKKIEQENKLLIEENNKNRNIKLNTAENLYRLLADNSMHLVCLHNLDMTFKYVSPSIKAVVGYTPENLIGKTPMDFAHPEDIEGILTDFTNLLVNYLPIRIEYRYRNSEGIYIWLETDAKIIFDKEVPLKVQTSSRDISKRKRADLIVKNTLRQERKLNELRTNLVSTISHEFRTPMTTIRTSAELIEMYLEGHNSQNEKQLRKQINRITSEIDRIVDLMNSVLIISKDDSGKTTFEPIKFDLKALVIAIVETSFSDNIKGQKVDLHFNGNSFLIFADKNLIAYALFNLLHNAFKYSENCRNIVLNLISYKSEIQVEIIDFGIGIPEEDKQKLFNTFYRASNTEGITGTGLGLYIVKTFIEKNSGTIELESQLGKGTKAILRLPKV